jgi:hypothetical protein
MTLTPVEFDFDSHELARLAAVLSACPDDLDLITMHQNECDARRLLYSSLSPEQRAIHQQLTDAGILNGPEMLTS